MQKWLWDPNTQFFYDYDLDQQVIQPVKTAAAFYALFGGIAKKSQASSLIDHLTNPNEFWTGLPIPSVAIDDPFYSQELWQGPVSIDQDFWLIIGLQRYNLNTTVVQLSEKILQYLNNSFNLYRSVFEFYPPMSYNMQGLSFQGNAHNARELHLGNTPLHSIFFRGILGGEILDDSINFIPDWTILKKMSILVSIIAVKKLTHLRIERRKS